MHSTADEWLRDMDWDDRHFRDFIEWCYMKYPEQMGAMAVAYTEGDGERAYQEYLAFEEERY